MTHKFEEQVADLEMNNMCMKMKMEAVEQSRTDIDEELQNFKADYDFVASERDSLQTELDKVTQERDKATQERDKIQQKLWETMEDHGNEVQQRSTATNFLSKTNKELEKKKTLLIDTQEKNKEYQELYEKIRGTLEYERNQHERRILEIETHMKQTRQELEETRATLKTTHQNLNWAQDRLHQRKDGDRVLIVDEPLPARLTSDTLKRLNTITNLNNKEAAIPVRSQTMDDTEKINAIMAENYTIEKKLKHLLKFDLPHQIKHNDFTTSGILATSKELIAVIVQTLIDGFSSQSSLIQIATLVTDKLDEE